MLKHIATINEQNICTYIVTGEYREDIELEENQMFVESTDVLGKKLESGEWVEVEQEEATPEPSQLDRIEAAVAKSNEEIANAAIDEYTAMLMEEGVL